VSLRLLYLIFIFVRLCGWLALSAGLRGPVT
jgi:hypothetical protein